MLIILPYIPGSYCHLMTQRRTKHGLSSAVSRFLAINLELLNSCISLLWLTVAPTEVNCFEA